jgi:predicted DCC family thiol-disulfide oxidoreductase YuxK
MTGVLGNPDIRLSQAYLLYDSRCGPCTSFMKIVKVLDLHGKLTPVSIHANQAEAIVKGLLSKNRLKSSFHIVEVSNAGSEVYSAGDGLVRLTRYAPAGRVTFAIVSRVKFLRQFLRWTYYQSTKIRSASKNCPVN